MFVNKIGFGKNIVFIFAIILFSSLLIGLVSATALDVLGPQFTFKTEVYYDGRNLYVKGYGDPLFVSERLWYLVNELSREGLSSISGDLVLDDTYFDRKKFTDFCLFRDNFNYVQPFANNKWLIWKNGIDVNDVDRAIDKALTEVCSQWKLEPLSLLANAGYQIDLASSNWQEVGSGTLTIQSATFPATFSSDTMLLVSGAASDYVESESVYVTPNKRFDLYIPASVRVGTSTIVVRDVTNGNNITLSGVSTTTTGRGFELLSLSGTFPAGCFEVTIRLYNGTGSSDTTEWGPVHFLLDGQRRFSLPPRIDTEKKVGSVYRQSWADVTTGGQDTYYQEDLAEIPNVNKQQQGANVTLTIPKGYGGGPLFFEERAYYSALSSGNFLTDSHRSTGDAVSTDCPLAYVVPATVKELCEQYITKHEWDTDFWRITYAKALDKLQVAERDYGPKAMVQQSRKRGISVPHVGV